MQPNEESQEAWTRYAEIHCVVDMTPTWQRIKTPTLSSHRVQLYRGIHHDKRVRSMCGRMRMIGSLDQVARLFQGENPKFNTAFYRDLIDDTTLANMPNTRLSTSIKLKRATMMHSKLARDVVYVEYQEHVELANKRRGYVVAMNSVDEPSIPSSVDGISRARMRHSGVIAYETAIRGVIEVCYVLHLDFVQPASQTLCDRLMMQRILSLRHVAQWSKPAAIRWVSSILSL
ncbi:hypothetical protein LEN26_017859 [Aphanomyces euteiches]|nr:hypothetical protein LEN26_017859 [Aphanomyces euteiches]